jgi:DNA end-binding protein Ku
MAQRPIWRGHLKLALLTCLVALYNARHERNMLKFHQLAAGDCRLLGDR